LPTVEHPFLSKHKAFHDRALDLANRILAPSVFPRLPVLRDDVSGDLTKQRSQARRRL
jgi:hypothetical protein